MQLNREVPSVIDIVLVILGIVLLIRPQWIIGLVYHPARRRRLRWLEMLLVLTGIYCAGVGLIRLITS